MKATTLGIALVLLVLAGCGDSANRTPGDGGARKVPEPEVTNPIMDPDHPEMTKRAPDVYRAKFDTTAGDFVIEVHRDWAPRGADRFYNLVRNGFYDGTPFFRVLPGFVVQWGMTGDTTLDRLWQRAAILDDPVTQSNTKGMVTFATAGPNTRSTHVFVNYGDNSRLDADGFAPFGRVVEGMDVVESIESKYGDTPKENRIRAEGEEYLRYFPDLDRIERATIVK